VDDLFEGYDTGTAWDEMFEPTGRPRKPASGLYEALSTLSVGDLGERSAESDMSFRDQGITFGFSGEDRPFPLDPIPRLVSAAELLRVMWSDKSRPSLRWLREQQARRTIPHIKIGGRVWFRPSQVDKWLDEWQEGRPKLQR